jgi:hypothetical protein
MDRPYGSPGRVLGAARPVRILPIVVLSSLVICAVVLLDFRSDKAPPPGVMLSSGTGFSISGTVSQVTPGFPSPLTVTLHNELSVPITLISVTVAVSPTSSVPSSCPGTDLTLVEQSTVSPLTGGPPQATLTLPSPRPIVDATSFLRASLFSIMLLRTADNSCQNVTFPLAYSATATVVAPPPATAPETNPNGPLPFTGSQIAGFSCAAAALVVAGLLAIATARRRNKGVA